MISLPTVRYTVVQDVTGAWRVKDTQAARYVATAATEHGARAIRRTYARDDAAA